jgi:uncharacterized protein (TIGR02246 family)
MTEAREAIDRAVQLFTDAFRRGDSAAVASLYAEGARLLPPHHQMVEGVEAIRQFWQAAMEMGAKEGRLETLEVISEGGLACEVGRYTLVVEQGNGERVSDVGKYVVVWRREGGD